VVSGLALGIDACAHRTALNRGMRTLAVTGSGLDKRSFYPGANLKLMRQMVEAGNAVISEFPPGTPPLKINFPARNRIIAGLVRGVVVIEAGRRSGALITSRYALEFGRDVFALPNDIFSPLSFGPNDLIKRGAVPVTCPEDILEYYGWTEEPRRAKTIPAGKLNDDERLIFKNLCHKPRHANELARLTRLDTSKIMSTLTIMEIKGIVKDIGNLEYVKL